MTNGLNWQPKELPLTIDAESKVVLKRLPKAHAALAELKGIASTIPHQGILINTLVEKPEDLTTLRRNMTNYLNIRSLLFISQIRTNFKSNYRH